MADLVVTDYPDIRARARELALSEVEALALLPEGIEHPEARRLIVNGESATLRKLLLEAGLHVQVLGQAESSTIAVRKSADLLLPVLFVGASLWSQNPVAVQLAMNVISSYVTDALKTMRPVGRVRFSVAVETTGKRTTKLLTYEGPPDGIDKLTSAIERIAHEE
jgi:hypothetical protein